MKKGLRRKLLRLSNINPYFWLILKKTVLYGGCFFRTVFNQLPEKDRDVYCFAEIQEEKDEIWSANQKHLV